MLCWSLSGLKGNDPRSVGVLHDGSCRLPTPILQFASYYGNREKLRPDGPLGSNTDFFLLKPTQRLSHLPLFFNIRDLFRFSFLFSRIRTQHLTTPKKPVFFLFYPFSKPLKISLEGTSRSGHTSPRVYRPICYSRQPF